MTTCPTHNTTMRDDNTCVWCKLPEAITINGTPRWKDPATRDLWPITGTTCTVCGNWVSHNRKTHILCA